MRRLIRRVLRGAIVLAVVGGLVGAGTLAWFMQQLPPLKTLQNYEPALITTVYDRHGRLLTEYAAERREIVPLEQIPQHVVRAFLAAEDDNFYDHFGIEPLAIVRAIMVNIAAGRKRQGASTITQQVARSFFLTQEKTYTRKIKEMLLALRLEANLSKEEILFLYLNQIYLGRGAYGVGSAAELFFGKDPQDLSVAEGAILAGLPQRPSDYAPHISPEQARNRQLYVIERMAHNGWLSPDEADAARAELVPIVRWEALFWQAPYAAEEVRRWLLERFPENVVMAGGLQVYTTIDLEADRLAQRAVQQGLEALDKRQGYRGPVTHLSEAERGPWLARQRARMLAKVGEVLQDGVMTFVGPETAVAEHQLARAAELDRPVTDVIPDDMIFHGVVTGYSRAQNVAWVNFGLGVGRLPGAGMFWAREPDIEVPAGRDLIEDPRKALRTGDVIQVRRYFVPGDPEHYARRMAMPPGTAARMAEKAKELQEVADGGPGSLILALEQEPKVQGALVSVIPQTGEIVAMVGGYRYATSQFNRATQAKRQPGSAFKPIVYAAALEKKFTPASILVDTPVVYEDVEREFRWKPKNYEGKFYGPMTLVDALTYSRNVVTIQLVRELGIRPIQDMARRLGIESALPDDLSMALGSGVVTPLEIVRPYATFANGGRRPELSLVREVWDATGKPVYQYFPPAAAPKPLAYSPFADAPPPVGRNVPFGLRAATPVSALVLSEFPETITPETAYQMTYLLRNVVERGTGWRARAVGHGAVGKTGTTDENIDSWFVGFTPYLATSVWVGFDQLAPLGMFETGSRAASPIWTDFMVGAHQGLAPQEFAIPPGIVFREIDNATGRLASPISEKILLMPFEEGTEPDAVRTGGQDPVDQGAQDLFMTDDYLHRPGAW